MFAYSSYRLADGMNLVRVNGLLDYVVSARRGLRELGVLLLVLADLLRHVALNLLKVRSESLLGHAFVVALCHGHSALRHIVAQATLSPAGTAAYAIGALGSPSSSTPSIRDSWGTLRVLGRHRFESRTASLNGWWAVDGSPQGVARGRELRPEKTRTCAPGPLASALSAGGAR